MRILVQRVLEASVTVNDVAVSNIKRGLLVLLGINNTDTKEVAEVVAQKTLKMRLWNEIPKKGDLTPEDEKKLKTWASCVTDNDFELLVVSQFTLYGYFNGNKPDFHNSRNAEEAKVIYEYFLQYLSKIYKPEKVQGGAFQQYMKVGLINDGPVTLSFDYNQEDLPKKKEWVKKPAGKEKEFEGSEDVEKKPIEKQKPSEPKNKKKENKQQGNLGLKEVKELNVQEAQANQLQGETKKESEEERKSDEVSEK